MIRYFVLFAFYPITFYSCEQKSNVQPINKSKIIEEVRLMFDNYKNDIFEKGLVAEFKYLDSSADFHWSPPGYTTSLNYDSVSAILRETGPYLQSVIVQIEQLKVYPLAENLCSYSCLVNSVVTDQRGEVTKQKLIESGVLIRRDDGWKLLSGQTASISNQ